MRRSSTTTAGDHPQFVKAPIRESTGAAHFQQPHRKLAGVFSGVLKDDLTDDFKQTQESTIGPTPVVIDLVGSPAELVQSVQENRAATFVRSKALDRVYCDGLRWANQVNTRNSRHVSAFSGLLNRLTANCGVFLQYDSLPAFVSDGPLINAWQQSWRNYVYGGERFVTGSSSRRRDCHSAAPPSPFSKRFNRDDEGVPAKWQSRRRLGSSLMQGGISLSARPGGPPLAEVTISNGRELFRRFVLEPNSSHFYRTLLLD